MSIIIFGTGSYYQKYKSFAFQKDYVVALVDNNPAKQGMIIDDTYVISPTAIDGLKYDYIVLFLAYPAAVDVLKQLISNGIDRKKILFYDEYIAYSCRGKFSIYYPNNKKVAIISKILDYSGSSTAILNLSISLIQKGYAVTLFIPFGDLFFIKEFNEYGIEVIECPSFLCISDTELQLIKQFDFIIVNTLLMIDTAFKICGHKPIIWWLHEPSDNYYNLYKNIFIRYPYYLQDNRINDIPIYVVSDIARQAFTAYFPSCIPQLLPPGIKDKSYPGINSFTTEKNSITFAIIGILCKLKHQVLFLQAALIINQIFPNRANFLIIGKIGNDDYSKQVLALAETTPHVKMTGTLSRNQIKELYQKEIDVVVCPSLEETLSLTVIEGMMFSKVCIASDKTGISDFIIDGVNGFICNTEEVNSLVNKMQYCIEHFDELSSLRLAARKTYEDNFSLQALSKRLDGIIKEICYKDNNKKTGG